MINTLAGSIEMKINTIEYYLSQYFDCLLFVSSQVHRLEETSRIILSLGYNYLNINIGVSAVLLNVLPNERSRAAQFWFLNMLDQYQKDPILCIGIDLLFHPSLQLDPFSLFRSASRIKSLIILWPGEYYANTLTYALPAHHHFRSWKLNQTLLQQPKVIIQPLPD